MLSYSMRVQAKQRLKKAMLAGYFSKAGSSAQIPVDYTEIRHVHKPSGAKPDS